MLMHVFNVGVGMTFSGGAIDLTLFGILQGNAKTNWVWIIVVGLAYAVIYYFVFAFMIRKFNYKTPGREADDEETKLFTRKDLNERNARNRQESADRTSALILSGLGGRDNISDIDCCATRLRVTVADHERVDKAMLTESGASGVIVKGNGVQIIYGPQVSVIKSNLESYLDSPESTGPIAKKQELFAHLSGTVVPLEKLSDEAFASGALGKGVAIEPKEGKLYAPCDGKIGMVYDTGHAVNVVGDGGCDVLMHIGVDTVKLGGKFFRAHVKADQRVKKGDLLISFDIEAIKKSGYTLTTPMVVCNSDDYKSVKTVAKGELFAGMKIIEIN